MAILEQEVWIDVLTRAQYYESLGYEIPRYIDKKGRLSIKKGTHILVKIKDLTSGSKARVTKICDDCKEIAEKTVPYNAIIGSRNKQKDGLDRCKKCSDIKKGMIRSLANETNCVATTHPEFAKLFWNVEDTFRYMYSSGLKADFKCLECGFKLENKAINNIYNQGLTCPRCSDGVSYPEKFMTNLLEQLSIQFTKEKTFKWSSRRKYDFYLPFMSCIIETHGSQHYRGKQRKKGRTLEEEQKNDKLKESLAKENKIENYIVIDCRKSELEWIKNSILDSELSTLLDLSKIDWLKCHEAACKSLVKQACDLLNSGLNVSKVSEMLNVSVATIKRYIKHGNLLGWFE